MTTVSEFIRFDDSGRAWLATGDGSTYARAKSSLRDDLIARAFFRPLPPELADLVDVAMAVYSADRLIRRRPTGVDPFELCWKRRLSLEIPVRVPKRWHRPEVGQALQNCLEFLTEDDWDFKFVQRKSKGRSSERQLFAFTSEQAEPVQVALFSGGLDSLAGLAASLTEASAGSLVLVSGSTHPRLSTVLNTLFGEFRRSRVRNCVSMVLPLKLEQAKAHYNLNEKSQRSRGFLYGTLGAVSALMGGGREVLIYENGIGSINLPYSPAQFGTHSTRSTNPVALVYLGHFVRLFVGEAIEFRLPNLMATKSEMCKVLKKSPLRRMITLSVTCDSFPLRRKRAAQCGVCTSCLLRRQALWAAGLEAEDPGDLYFYDVMAPPANFQDKRWHPLRDMLGQVDTFKRALATTRPWDALVGEFPMLQRVAWSLEEGTQGGSSNDSQRHLMSLIDRYCAEWEAFPARPPKWRFGIPDHGNDWRFRHAC